MHTLISVRRASLVGFLVTTLIACSDNDDDTSGPDSDMQDPVNNMPSDMSSFIDWQPCSTDANLDCATLEVPLIHDSTDTRTLSISLNRLSSTGTSPRLLMLNPGGPGGSGTEALELINRIDAIPEKLREAFDLVGFDPRGVGGSESIDCSEFLTDAMTAEYVATRSELVTLAADTTAFSAACVEKYGDRLNWFGSNQVVRDMDLIRASYGADKLDFLGFSYGTRLAALYLQRFPETSGRMILDGALAPDSSLSFLVEGSAVAYQSNLQRLFQACELTANDCDPSTIEATLQTRIATSIANNDPAFGVFVSLLALAAREIDFGDIAAAPLLDYIVNGDATVLENFVTFLETTDIDFGDEGVDNNAITTIQRAVLCADDPIRASVDDLESTLATLNAVSDTAAEVLVGSLSTLCTGWPASVDPVPLIATSQAPVSLIIGGTSDVQTPGIWAPLLGDAIGGQVLMSDHSGHTVFLSQENACVEDAGLNFLLEGTLPETTFCEREADVESVEE